MPADSNLASLLRDAYESVGALDEKNFLANQINNCESLLTGNDAWIKILIEQDAAKSSNVESTLMELGLYNLALSSCKSNSETHFECAWRLSDWSLLDTTPTVHADEQNSFEKYHYEALKSIHNQNFVNLKYTADEARKAAINILKNTSTECPKSLYRTFNMLERVQQIEDFCKVRIDRKDHEPILTKWNQMDQLPKSDFKYEELKVAQRICLLKEAGIVASRGWVPGQMEDIISNLIDVASKTKNERATIRYIALLKNIKPSRPNLEKALIADADICYRKADLSLAEVLLKEASKSNDSVVKMTAYRKLGEYMSTSISNSSNKIFDDYFIKSVHTLENYAKSHDRFEDMKKGIYDDDKIGENLKQNVIIYETIARYYDKEYTRVVNYINGTSYQEKKEMSRKLEASIHEMQEKTKKDYPFTNEEKATLKMLITNHKIDQKHFYQVQVDREKFAKESLVYYLKHCTFSPDLQNLNVFRILSLWMANKNVSNF